MDPTRPAGLVAFGTHAPSVDAVCACLMGLIQSEFHRRECIPLCFVFIGSGDWRASKSKQSPEWNGCVAIFLRYNARVSTALRLESILNETATSRRGMC